MLQPIDLLGWLGSIAVLAAVSFSTYDMVKEEGAGPVMWSKERLVAWEVLSRSAWAVCICWIIFSVHYGGGGILVTVPKILLQNARMFHTPHILNIDWRFWNLAIICKSPQKPMEVNFEDNLGTHKCSRNEHRACQTETALY